MLDAANIYIYAIKEIVEFLPVIYFVLMHIAT